MCAATKRIPDLESRASLVTAGDGATRAVLSKVLEIKERNSKQFFSIRRMCQDRVSGDVHLPAVNGVGGGANFNLPRCLTAIVKLDHFHCFSTIQTI